LLDGTNLISTVDSDRWSLESFSHFQKNHPGSAYTFSAGSVGDISQFDAGFFGISPREAAQIDPQQRALLELCWQALEDAGIKPSSIRGSACGVYIGISSADYSYRLAEDMASIDSAVATGNTASIAANRISYFFDLRGPSMAIDTACSSSLVAFHQACQAIRSGEITQALTGGISLHLHPYGFIVFSKASMLSPNGNCNVFDENGDGYVRSEGGGMFVLKDYDLAVADGDRILAVVAQSAINTDGKKSGLTIPKPEAQAELLASTYAAAGISPDEISYLEAHGTGTAVGDPIETLAIGTSIGQHRQSSQPLPIGSVKSNLGHLEAASGVAGLVKALFVIQHRKIPPTIGIKTLNSRIDFKGLNLDVVTQTRVLPQDQPVIVGVNSFGFGGANAHVILRSHETTETSTHEAINNLKDSPAQVVSVSNTLIPILISAATPLALQAAASRIARALTDSVSKGNFNPDSLYDTAYQLAFRREAFEHRAVVFSDVFSIQHNTDFVSKVDDLSKQLAVFADGSDNSAVATGVSLNSDHSAHGTDSFAKGPAFIYSGNGSQWRGMGRALLDNPVFKASILEIDQTFIGLAEFSILDLLAGILPELNYENTAIAQPALFAVQVGVTNMLAEMGVKAHAVAGHSVGEVAAAWAAGILDLPSAITVIYHRSRLQQLTKGRGNMTAAALDAHTAEVWLNQLGLSDDVCVAGINSHRGITLAGAKHHLSIFESYLTRERIGFKRLDLDYAFHSPAMDEIESEINRTLSHLTPQSGSIPFYSTVTGGLLAGSALTANYWWQNIRQPVLFEQATEALLNAGFQVLAEIGPHPVLRGYLNDCVSHQSGQTILNAKKCIVLPSLTRQQDKIQDIHKIVAHIWIAGAEIDLSVYFPVVGRHVSLPSYPWQREHHWHSVSAESPNTLHRVMEHPLLGYRLPQHDLLWENKLDPYRQSFLADHVVGDAVVFPGTGYIELALAAAKSWHSDRVQQLEELEILAPITFNSSHGKVLRVGIDVADGRVSIQSRDLLSAEGWTLNARARIIQQAIFPTLDVDNAAHLQSLEQLSLRLPDFDAASHLALTRQVGLQYGESFNAIQHGWLGGIDINGTPKTDRITALFNIPQSITDSLDKFFIHPALLDCSFQLIIQLLRDKIDLSAGIAFIPTQISRISLQTDSEMHHLIPHHVEARLLRKLTHSLLAEFTVFDTQGRAIVRVEGARFRRVRLQNSLKSVSGNASLNTAIKNIHTHYIPLPLQPGKHVASVNYQAMLASVNNAARRNILDRNYLKYVDELDPLLDALCSRYASETLIALGFTSDETKNESMLQNLVNQSPDTSALLHYIIELSLDVCQATEVDAAIDQIDALTIWNTLFADYPDYFGVIHTVGKVGQHLRQIVTGEQSLGEVLGKISGIASLTDELMGNAVKSRMLQAVREVFKITQQQLDASSRIGVLEVAAVKPTLIRELIDEINTHACSHQCDVIFSCPDLSTLENVHELVEERPQLRLTGFAADTETESLYAPVKDYRVDLALVWLQFDTAKLNNQAIDYALKHLKPGGTLLVVGQHRTRWLDFIFGGWADWWLYQPDMKQTSMQRDRAMWETRLASLGFENVRHMDTSEDSTAGAYLLIAQHSVFATTQAPKTELPRSWLILDDDSGSDTRLRDAICSGLQSQGDIVSVLSQDDLHHEVEDISNHLISMRGDFGELDGIIHIKGIGTPYVDYASKVSINRALSAANLLKACQQTDIHAAIWFITKGACALENTKPILGMALDTPLAADALLIGFIRTLSNEHITNPIKQIDLGHGEMDQSLIEDLIDELVIDSPETEVVLSPEHGRFVPRLMIDQAPSNIEYAEKNTERNTLELNFSQPGQLRNLQWQFVARKELEHDEVEIEVEATGLNFRDVMYALGLLSDEAIENGFAGTTIGLECAGKITRIGKEIKGFSIGERVVGFGPACFANRVVTKASAVSYIPRALSAEAAATIPSTFLTSYYALIHLGRLEHGEKVLIHGAAGGVGLAAIQIARWRGAEIFATAGSDEKRDLLRMMGVDHVLDSRTLSFAEDIKAITQGAGIDMVLNSLAGEAINRNFSILKPFGRFLELGKRDFYENTRIGLRPFRNNITYFGIDADQLMNERPELTAQLFGEVMTLFEKGILHALPFTSFEARDVIDAFHFMQQSQQIGKIVVTYRNGIPVDNTLPTSMSNKKEQLQLDSHASYLVTGGLGGFGLRTALWLADQGAKHLILLGRRGADTDEARSGIQTLESKGVSVSAFACDITNIDELSKNIEPWLPKLKGIIHAAAVIEDSLIENLSAELLHRVISPKVTGAINLHTVTREHHLDFFVMYSSATTLFGNPGQAAYIAANCGLEALAQYRLARGLPATCMLWGAIDDSGFLARNKQIKEALQHRMGGQALTSLQALERLEQAILHRENNVGVLELDFAALSKFLPNAHSPRLRELARLGSKNEQDDENSLDIPRILNELDDIGAAAVLMNMVKIELSQILRIAPDKIDTSKSIFDMGLDSLMGVELVVALEARFGVRLSVMAISENPSIEKLTQRLVSLLRAQTNDSSNAEQHSPDTIEHNPRIAQISEIAKLHGSEASQEEILALAESLDGQTVHQAGKFLQ
jgi:acyl transferase domain-containing protein/NADPH:quinone reductase-like Zn-dependent oxidoreductase/acyl carrier protein/short-subunit dehydrogenase